MASRSLTVLVTALLLAPPSAVATADERIGAEDFSVGTVDEFPLEWMPRTEAGRGVYSIREPNGRRVLTPPPADPASGPPEWDLAADPVLAWSWRPIGFPAGADERAARTASYPGSRQTRPTGGSSVSVN